MFQKIKTACLALPARVCLVLSLIFLSPGFKSKAHAQVLGSDYALMLGASAAAVLAASALDESAQAYFSGKGRIGDLSWVGNNVLGKGVPGLLLGGGFWLGGYLTDRPYELHAGRAQVESIVATGLVVTLLKSLSNRRRPNGEDSYSFPSAHTAYAFTTAAVLNEFYGWKVGVPAYLLGALTATSRMQDNQHWLSDTVAGAAIAVMIGTAISRWHLGTLEKEKSKLIPEVSPAVDPDHVGVQLKWEF